MGGGGKAGGGATQYNYYGTVAGGVCSGPVDELVAIIINGQEVWPKGTPWAVGINCAPGTLYVFDAQSWTCTTPHQADTPNAPGSGQYGWTEYSYARGAGEDYTDFQLSASDGTFYGTMTFYWGTSTQTVDYLLQSSNNDSGASGNYGNGDQHPDYKNVSYVVIKDFLLGQDVQSAPNIEVVVRRKPNQSTVIDALATDPTYGSAANIYDGQANLAAVCVELLTDKNYLGLPTSSIDATSFNAVAKFLQSNQGLYNASVLLDSSTSINEVLDELTQMFDGYIRFNSNTSKIEIGVYQHGVYPGSSGSLQPSYVTIDATHLTELPKFSSSSWKDTVSRATVRFNSRQLNYQQTSVQVDDPRAFAVLGSVREQSLDRSWIARQSQATQHGMETLRVIGHAKTTGEIKVRREIARNIKAGDYVFVDVDLEPNSYAIKKFFRVQSRTIPPTGPITLSLFADQTLAYVPWSQNQQNVLAGLEVVNPVTNFRFIEVQTALSGTRGSITLLAQRPDQKTVGASVYFDHNRDGTFPKLGDLQTYAAKASLTSNVALTDSTIQVAVDLTQADANYFTQQYTDVEQNNDTMLAILVSVGDTVKPVSGDDLMDLNGSPIIGLNGDSDLQVSEDSSGYQIVEICSVGTQSLTGTNVGEITGVGGSSLQGVSGENIQGAETPTSGYYTLNVLRGRKNSFSYSFNKSNTEVWLIPQSVMSFYHDLNFDILRANSFSGATPNNAQLRICPRTYIAELPLSSAATYSYKFPPASASAPTLTIYQPTSKNLSYLGNTTWPLGITFSGEWVDPDTNLVEISILIKERQDDDYTEMYKSNFSQTEAKGFKNVVYIDKAGIYSIRLQARDSTNLVTNRDFSVDVSTGVGQKCAPPIIFTDDMQQITGSTYDSSTTYTFPDPLYPIAYNTTYPVRPVFSEQVATYGKITMRCTTKDAQIRYCCGIFVGRSTGWSGYYWGNYVTYGAGSTYLGQETRPWVNLGLDEVLTFYPCDNYRAMVNGMVTPQNDCRAIAGYESYCGYREKYCNISDACAAAPNRGFPLLVGRIYNDREYYPLWGSLNTQLYFEEGFNTANNEAPMFAVLCWAISPTLGVSDVIMYVLNGQPTYIDGPPA